MAEIAHTCINAASWASPPPPCPGCQALHEQIATKEREVLAAVLVWSDSKMTRDAAKVLHLGAELQALTGKRQSFG